MFSGRGLGVGERDGDDESVALEEAGADADRVPERLAVVGGGDGGAVDVAINCGVTDADGVPESDAHVVDDVLRVRVGDAELVGEIDDVEPSVSDAVGDAVADAVYEAVSTLNVTVAEGLGDGVLVDE
jgi:hypothetical protein